jgi:His-Xaa-Ser system protein HxsD
MTQLSDGRLSTRISTNSYSVNALRKAAYRLAARCTIVIQDSRDPDRVEVEFRFGRDSTDEDVADVTNQFFRDATDYELRDRISTETAAVRNLILAHAFSRTRFSDNGGE